MSALNAVLLGTVSAATPLVYAGLGELVAERAGVLNLGVEGMMTVGALAAFAVGVATGNLWLAYGAGAAAGMLLALLFACLTLSLQANQVAAGLALTIFGLGLSAFAGKPYAGLTGVRVQPFALPFAEVPVLGVLAQLTVPVVGAVLVYGGIEYFLKRTRAGLWLRATGESPAIAHALGAPVVRIRYLATLFGGAMAGVAGAYLATALMPSWAEGISAGRGWIALALVVFATWRPLRVLLGACLFGGVTVAQLYAQGLGVQLPSEALSMLPYLATIAVLVLICRDPRTLRLSHPASLGKAFHPDA